MSPVRFLCATNLADRSRHRRAVGFSFHGRRRLTEQLEPQLPTCCFASSPDTTSELPPLTGPPSRLEGTRRVSLTRGDEGFTTNPRVGGLIEASNTLYWWPTTRSAPLSNPQLRATRPTSLRSTQPLQTSTLLSFATTRDNRSGLVRDEGDRFGEPDRSRFEGALTPIDGLWQSARPGSVSPGSITNPNFGSSAISVVRRAQLTSRPALQSAASLALQSAHRYDGYRLGARAVASFSASTS